MTSAAARVRAVLDRYPWWISGLLTGVLVVGLGGAPDRSDPAARILFGLFLGLVWLPLGLRVARSLRGGARAFRDGLRGR